MINFIKGLITGMGGVSPGFSGSILLVMFGLYETTLEAIATIFKDFKKNVLFLFPILAGMALGFIAFGTVFGFLIEHVESYTRYASFGLVLGTIPLLYRETKKKDFKKKYYLIMLASFIFGIAFFIFNRSFFTPIEDPNIFQSIIIGVAVAATSIVPGVNGAVVLAALRTIRCFCSINIFTKLWFWSSNSYWNRRPNWRTSYCIYNA